MDSIGINLSDYLFASGISGFILNTLILSVFISALLEVKFDTVAILILNILFNIIWIIIGGIILFRSNIECINSRYNFTIYTLVLWI